jgi:hypothetical protein
MPADAVAQTADTQHLGSAPIGTAVSRTAEA